MKYPILLIHGMGFRDDHKIGYWGRIPKALTDNGFEVILSGQDSNGSVESNARQIARRFDSLLVEHNAEKVNIIAHSKGGLEARYLASALGFEDRIASITTLSTPHNGSLTVDSLMKVPTWLIKAGCGAADLWFRLLGDKQPDTYGAICSFRTADAEQFNSQYPDSDKIFYQSYGFTMKKSSSDMLMWFPNLVVKHFDGTNDGLLSPDSVRWTNFQTVVTGERTRGVSHCDEVDMRRRKLRIRTDYGIIDIPELYVNIAKDLEQKGF